MTTLPSPHFEADDATLAAAQQVGEDFSRFMLNYRFALDEIETKLNILKREFEHLHDYSPIEHVKSRLKSVDSIVHKVRRTGGSLSQDMVRENVRDIAGVRVVCSFVSDAYAVADMVAAQADITVVQIKDYIAHPKPNGYKSLHLVITVPIFLSGSVEDMYVELQIRTVAMDFWASLEHKIYYKYDQEIPADLLAELTDAAAVANNLDDKMQRIHAAVRALPPRDL